MSKTYIPAALRRLVGDRANHACEYCLIPEIAALLPYEVDHVIAQKHGGQTDETNLALACTICNKYKGRGSAIAFPYFTKAIAFLKKTLSAMPRIFWCLV